MPGMALSVYWSRAGHSVSLTRLRAVHPLRMSAKKEMCPSLGRDQLIDWLRGLFKSDLTRPAQLPLNYLRLPLDTWLICGSLRREREAGEADEGKEFPSRVGGSQSTSCEDDSAEDCIIIRVTSVSH